MNLQEICTPSIIIYNGCVHTVDENNSIVEAIAILGNKILAVGKNEEILRLAADKTVLIDAKTNSVIPGIIDSHNHMWEAGILMEGIITLGIDSINKLKDQIKEKLINYEKGRWLQGGGWIETQFKENRMPLKYDLDEVAPNNPVVLERIFSTCVANSYALKLANITKDTPDPKGGEIGRDPVTGEPNGLLFRTAKQLVRNVMDTPFGSNEFQYDERIEIAIEKAMNEYIKYGITSVVEPGVTPAIIKAYQNLKQSNRLSIRTNLMPNWHGFAINESQDFSDRLIKEYGLYTGFGDEWLKMGALKMAIDGGLTSRTQLSSWPYLGEDKPREVPLRLELSKLNDWVKEAHDAGWSVGIHVMGDIAIEKAVDAIYLAHKENPVKRRHQLIHSYYPTKDSLEKMAEVGVIAALQPAFIYNEADGYSQLLPHDKIQSFLPMRTYMDSNVIVAASTDMPSAHVNPYWGLYAAVTRKGIQGFQLGTSQCITIDEAIRAMTYNGAYLTGEENIKGSIEAEKLADIVILNRNLYKISESEIKDIQANYTIIDGKYLYSKYKK